MGLDYSFEIAVPRAQLSQAMTLLAQRAHGDCLAPLVWPDGRRLPGTKMINGADPIPVDGSLSVHLCLSLLFDEDEALRHYNEESIAEDRRCGQPIYDLRQQGQIRLGCIYLSLGLTARSLRWFDESESLIHLGFTAATTRMSRLFDQSSSIRSFFVNLAAQMGAYTCDIDKEGEGWEQLYVSEAARRSGQPIPLDLYRVFGREETASERKARSCDIWSRQDYSAHQQLEVRLLTRDADSGVRAHALRTLARLEPDEVESFLAEATCDPQWRVRAVAAYLIGNHEVENGFVHLERLSTDSHPEVRIAAISALSQFSSALTLLREVLLQTPTVPSEWGLIHAALVGVSNTIYEPFVVPTLEAARARSGFPFPNTVDEKLKIFQPRSKQ